MAMGSDHINFTAADINRYHRGLLSAKERHALEKAALEDPFLADALEGYANAASTGDDRTELAERLAARVQQESKTPIVPIAGSSGSRIPGWLRVAAVTVFIAGTALLVYRFNQPSPSREITYEIPPHNNTKKDTASPIISGTPLAKDSFSASLSLTTEANAQGLAAPGAPRFTVPQSNGIVNQEVAKTYNYNVTTAEKKTQQAADATTASPSYQPYGNLPIEVVKDNADTGLLRPDVGYTNAAKQRPLANNNDFNKSVFQNQNMFRGRVTDAQNNALPFSNVTNLDDNVGTYSDSKGYFNLLSPDSVLNVRVRSVGFESNVVQLRNLATENRVTLQEDQSMAANVLDTTKRNMNRSRTSTMVLQEPEPVDGWTNYDTYLTNNLKAPEARNAKRYSGEVELSFEVDSNGDPSNITVTKSLCESCDREAIRLLKEGPKWKRKKKKRVTLTVNF